MYKFPGNNEDCLAPKNKSIQHVFIFDPILFSSILESCQHDEILLIEAEIFQEKRERAVDPQFVEIMGSPYLLAHGLGRPLQIILH